MWKKILGLLFVVTGLGFVVFFPDWINYQPEEMGKAGVGIGLILISLGIYLMIS